MKKLILLIIIASYTISANAQWQSNGPFGNFSGTINCFAVSGSYILAGTDSGIYISANQGNSWAPADSGLKNLFVLSLAASDSNIFAGTDGGGAFLSTAPWHGGKWAAVNNGLTDSLVLSLYITGSKIVAATAGDVFLSTDNGSSWTSTGLYPPANITSMAASGSQIFAGTYGDGIFLSANDGGSWAAADSGLTDSSIVSLAISGSNILAGIEEGGVFLSTDNGGYWTAINTGLPSNSTVNAFSINGSTIFAGTNGNGIFVSTNNGDNWTATNVGLPPYAYVYSFAISDSMIFAGTSNGVWQQPLQTALGIEEPQTLPPTRFTLFPNPANNNFTLETNILGEPLLQVFDITGKLMFAQTIQNPKTSIDASSLAEGMYLVSLKSADGVGTGKLVIAR